MIISITNAKHLFRFSTEVKQTQLHMLSLRDVYFSYSLPMDRAHFWIICGLEHLLQYIQVIHSSQYIYTYLAVSNWASWRKTSLHFFKLRVKLPKVTDSVKNRELSRCTGTRAFRLSVIRSSNSTISTGSFLKRPEDAHKIVRLDREKCRDGYAHSEDL